MCVRTKNVIEEPYESNEPYHTQRFSIFLWNWHNSINSIKTDGNYTPCSLMCFLICTKIFKNKSKLFMHFDVIGILMWFERNSPVYEKMLRMFTHF